jgi:hypothetical protein
MSKRPPRDFLMMNIAKTDARQVLIAKYLRDTGKIASQLMGAADAHFYSYALAAESDSSDAEVELAVIESVIALDSQINRIINFHRINRQINLPPEFLRRYGLMSMSQSATPASEGLASMPHQTDRVAQVLVREVSCESEEEDDEDDEEQDWNQSGLNISPAVLTFLNGR